jgi:hypothetical protein
MIVRQIAVAASMLAASVITPAAFAASAASAAAHGGSTVTTPTTASTAAASVANFIFNISNTAGFPNQQVGTLKIEQIGADTKWTLKADWNNSLNSGNPFVFGVDFALNPGTTLHDSSLPLSDVTGQIGVRTFGSSGVFFTTANNTNRFTDGEAASWIFHGTTIGGFRINDLHVNAIYNGNSVKFGPSTSPIPEPETYALMLAGLAGLGFVARRKKAIALK